MILSEPVFAYCERQSGEFWAEPANALSNAAFLVAAGLAYVFWRRRGATDRAALALIIVTAVVGVGSFIFHTLATRGAELLDVIPIAIFIYGYFLLALRRFFGLGAPAALALTLFFAIASYGVGETLHGLNGSLAYLPALLALAVFSLLLWWRGHAPEAASRNAARGLGAAAALFFVSLAFRTVDRAICGVFPLGAHFVWHLLNAVVLWLLLKTAITHATPSEKA
jgi:hypothetical protein